MEVEGCMDQVDAEDAGRLLLIDRFRVVHREVDQDFGGFAARCVLKANSHPTLTAVGVRLGGHRIGEYK